MADREYLRADEATSRLCPVYGTVVIEEDRRLVAQPQRCVAGRCMAWRWRGATVPVGVPRDPEVDHPLPGERLVTVHGGQVDAAQGWCVLMGYPPPPPIVMEAHLVD